MTLTCSPILNQMLRTKFSSIHGSSSPILRACQLQCHLGDCVGWRQTRAARGNSPERPARRRKCCRAGMRTYQSVVFPSLPCWSWPAPGTPMLPPGKPPAPLSMGWPRSACWDGAPAPPGALGCSPVDWPWKESKFWKDMTVANATSERKGGVGGRARK